MQDKMCSNRQEDSIKAEKEFWEALVLAEGVQVEWQSDSFPSEASFQVADEPQAKISYPWNPLSAELEEFLTAPASTSIFDGLSEDEVMKRSHTFFGRLEQLWPTANLQTVLTNRFAARVPQDLLHTIAQKVQDVFSEAQQAVSDASNGLADQLVQCVRDLTPSLAEEDFYVLVRPLAVQMRNGGLSATVDSYIAQIPTLEWEKLSDIQRARLGLAIARFAMSELQSNSDI